ncbi:hypothetical protein V6N13_067365 [Hibiscus sabdariffa]
MRVQPPWEVFDEGIEDWRFSLVGQFIGPAPNFSAMQKIVGILWGEMSTVKDSRKGLNSIASTIDTPLYMDSITTSRGRLEFAKVCIEITARVPIPKRVEVQLRDGSLTSIRVLFPGCLLIVRDVAHLVMVEDSVGVQNGVVTVQVGDVGEWTWFSLSILLLLQWPSQLRALVRLLARASLLMLLSFLSCRILVRRRESLGAGLQRVIRREVLKVLLLSLQVIEGMVRKQRVAAQGVAALLQDINAKRKDQVDKLKAVKADAPCMVCGSHLIPSL